MRQPSPHTSPNSDTADSLGGSKMILPGSRAQKGTVSRGAASQAAAHAESAGSVQRQFWDLIGSVFKNTCRHRAVGGQLGVRASGPSGVLRSSRSAKLTEESTPLLLCVSSCQGTFVKCQMVAALVVFALLHDCRAALRLVEKSSRQA